MESFCNTLSGDSLLLIKNNQLISLKDASKLNIIDIITFDLNTLSLLSTKGKVIKTNVTTLKNSSLLLYGKYTQFLTNVNNSLIYYELNDLPIIKLKIKDEMIEKFSHFFPTTHPDEFVQQGYTVKLLSGNNFLSPVTSHCNEYCVIKL